MQDEYVTDEFEYPTNIKQIGSIDSHMKIYIEDYVHTYIYNYAKTKGNSEKLAILLGKHYIKDGVDVLVISAAIKTDKTQNNGFSLQLTEEAWEDIKIQADKYFPMLSYIGWVHIQPEMGIFLSERDEYYHKVFFKNNFNVFYAVDHKEDMDCFYIYNSTCAYLVPSKGYFIYYDKNEAMQDYMIENGFSKPKQDPFAEEQEESNKIDRIDAAGRIRQVLNKKEDKKKHIKNMKYLAFGSMTACIIAVMLVMGINLFNNIEKITLLENELEDIKLAYENMKDSISSEIETKMVFELQKKEPEEAQNIEEDIPLGEYTIQYGDTLWDICERFYGSQDRLSDILNANNISDSDTIYAGEKLIIPK